MIARLLHIANSCPPASKAQRERFYAMKQRILRWFGTEDGHDLQYIEGKQCWGCEGTGMFYHFSGDTDECHRCWGSGWFKSPVWIVLKRWKFGRYTFHEPKQRLYRKPDTNSHDRPIIAGYVEHASYSFKDIHRARFVLYLMFDWRLLWDETNNWRFRKAIARRWHRLKRQPVTCVLEEDHDIPF